MKFDGTWNVVMKTPMGDRELVLTLSRDGDALSGNMVADDSTIEIEDGAVSGDRAKWKANLTSPIPLTLEFDVADESGNLDGTVKLGMFGSSAVTGTPA